jgi:hypothetical protein
MGTEHDLCSLSLLKYFLNSFAGQAAPPSMNGTTGAAFGMPPVSQNFESPLF